MGLNFVLISGNLTRDPELRYTPQGAAVCSFTVAVNERYKTTETTSYIRCKAWEKQGERVAEDARKGSRVVVTGKLTTNAWTDAQNNKRETTEVRVTTVDVLAKHERTEEVPMQQSLLPPDDLPF